MEEQTCYCCKTKDNQAQWGIYWQIVPTFSDVEPQNSRKFVFAPRILRIIYAASKSVHFAHCAMDVQLQNMQNCLSLIESQLFRLFVPYSKCNSVWKSQAKHSSRKLHEFKQLKKEAIFWSSFFIVFKGLAFNMFNMARYNCLAKKMKRSIEILLWLWDAAYTKLPVRNAQWCEKPAACFSIQIQLKKHADLGPEENWIINRRRHERARLIIVLTRGQAEHQ